MQRGRLAVVVQRKRRFERMGPTAARMLVNTGALPALRYGAGVIGANKTMIRAARRFACSVRGEMRGRSSYARLHLAKYDPGAQLATDPILEWSRAVWDSFANRRDLEAAWRAALPEISGAIHPFGRVRGPAGATVASTLRLGWQFPSPYVFVNRSGSKIDLRDTCPSVVLAHAKRDLQTSEAEASTWAGIIGGTPDLEALAGYLSSGAARRSAAAGSLRALGEGGWWSQERLHAAGMVEDPYCKACSPLAPGAADQLHRAAKFRSANDKAGMATIEGSQYRKRGPRDGRPHRHGIPRRHREDLER